MPECICPQWMIDWNDVERRNSPLALSRDKKLRQIKSILEAIEQGALFDVEMRGRVLKQAARKARVSEQYIRKILTRYWFFGAAPNALLRRSPDQGGPEVSRLSVNTRKPGAVLATMKLNPNTKLVGARMTQELHDMWETFLVQRAKEIHNEKGKVGLAGQFSIGDLWLEFRDKELVKTVRRNGASVTIPIPLHELPRKRRFMFYGAKIWKENILRRFFDNEADWLAVKSRRGYASDHTRGRITIYEVDGLLFNAQLLWGKNTLNPDGVGKAVVMIAADVETTAIVGVHITIQNESTNAYRNCLFNAFSDKTELLKTMGLEDLADGFVHGRSDEVRFDRGAGKSKGLVNPLTKEMKIGVRLARARQGRDKSVVESINRFVQDYLKGLPGFYLGSKSGHDKDSKAKSERWARVSFEKFVKLVLTFIHDWNTTRNVFHRLPEHMVKSGQWTEDFVSPKGYFDALKSKRLADAAIEWSPSETYARLIETESVKLSQGTIKVNSASYKCDGLDVLWNAHISTPSRKHGELWVDIKRHPDTNHFVLWVKKDGTTEKVPMVQDSRRKFGRNVWLVHRYRPSARAASLYGTEVRARKARLPGRMRQTMVEAHNLPRRPKAALGVKAANREQKALEEKHEAEQRAFSMFGEPVPSNPFCDGSDESMVRYNPDDDDRFAGDV